MARTRCPNCTWKGEIENELIGSLVVCPSCEQEFTAKRRKKAKRAIKPDLESVVDESSTSTTRRILKYVLPIGGILGCIFLFFFSAYLWDSSLERAGRSYLSRLELSDAERDFVNYFSYTLHLKARGNSEAKRGSKRYRASTGVFPQKAKYLSCLKKLTHDFLTDPSILNEYSWDMLKKGKNLRYALALSLKAEKLLAEDSTPQYDTKAAVLDTLALAYFKNGNKQKARACQLEAIKWLKRSGARSELPEFEKRLKMYQ